MSELEKPKPYIDDKGDLHIPMDADPKYHHWKSGGQSVLKTLKEIGAPKEAFRKHMLPHEYEKKFG